MIAEIIKLEKTLLLPEVRSNRQRLASLIHPEFLEIGYSGISYDFESVITGLLNSKPTQTEFCLQSFTLQTYASDIVQLCYLSAVKHNKEDFSRHAKRSSIWVREDGDWKIKFHQATRIAPFELSNV